MKIEEITKLIKFTTGGRYGNNKYLKMSYDNVKSLVIATYEQGRKDILEEVIREMPEEKDLRNARAETLMFMLQGFNNCRTEVINLLNQLRDK